MKILGTITFTDQDIAELEIMAITFAVFLLGGLAITWWVNWRSRPRRHVFTFRAIENLGPNWAGGDNAWHGCLVTDRYVDAITGQILRAAVERYQAKNRPPRDGDRFELFEGELCKL